MTFLWRYLVYYREESPYYYGSISNSGDYSSISSYARTPVYWAASNSIIFASGSSKKLYPLAAVSRKELALWVFRYGQNVDGIRYGQDNFPFYNSSENFSVDPEGGLRISEYHYNMLTYNMSESVIKAINEELEKPFRGVCFGMSLIVLLDKKGIIDYNGNFESNAENMYSVTTPSNLSGPGIYVQDRCDGTVFRASESVITFYSASRYRLLNYNTKYIGTDDYPTYESLINDLRIYGAALIQYSGIYNGESFGHVIAAYGMPKQNGSYYEITYYDPNELEESVLRISLDYENMFVNFAGESVLASGVSYCEDLFSLANIDVDGEYNMYLDGSSTVMENNQYDSANATSSDILLEGVWISVPSSGCYTITNSEGEELIIYNGDTSGSIEVFDTRTLFDEEGSILYFSVPESSSFTLAADNNISHLTASWDGKYCAFDGEGIERAILSPSSISISGEEMSYKMYATAGVGTYCCYEMNGTGESEATLRFLEDSAEAEGFAAYAFHLENILNNTVMESKWVQNGGLATIFYNRQDGLDVE